MPNFGMLPLGGTLLALATQTTTGSSAALSLPPASSYRLIVQVQTVSGTLPTFQLILATSCDAGSTYNEILSTNTQMTTSGLGQQLLIRPYRARLYQAALDYRRNDSQLCICRAIHRHPAGFERLTDDAASRYSCSGALGRFGRSGARPGATAKRSCAGNSIEHGHRRRRRGPRYRFSPCADGPSNGFRRSSAAAPSV